MKYAFVSEDTILSYPIELRNEFPHTSFPVVINAESLPEGVVEVLPVSPDEVEGFHPVEGAPVLIDGAWFQTWDQVEDDA